MENVHRDNTNIRNFTLNTFKISLFLGQSFIFTGYLFDINYYKNTLPRQQEMVS